MFYTFYFFYPLADFLLLLAHFCRALKFWSELGIRFQATNKCCLLLIKKSIWDWWNCLYMMFRMQRFPEKTEGILVFNDDDKSLIFAHNKRKWSICSGDFLLSCCFVMQGGFWLTGVTQLWMQPAHVQGSQCRNKKQIMKRKTSGHRPFSHAIVQPSPGFIF